jgi:PIN domain nuclease of toxin-antitoxin system
VILLDTHVLVWWAAGTARLSAKARKAITGAQRQGTLHASTISLLEIATAIRRGRLVLAAPAGEWLKDLLQLNEMRFVPVTPEIAVAAGTFDEGMPGDPADRIIVATAQSLGCRLVSADAALRRAPAVSAIW